MTTAIAVAEVVVALVAERRVRSVIVPNRPLYLARPAILARFAGSQRRFGGKDWCCRWGLFVWVEEWVVEIGVAIHCVRKDWCLYALIGEVEVAVGSVVERAVVR